MNLQHITLNKWFGRSKEYVVRMFWATTYSYFEPSTAWFCLKVWSTTFKCNFIRYYSFNLEEIFDNFIKKWTYSSRKQLMRRYLDRMWKITTIDQFKFFSEMMPMMNNQDFGRHISKCFLLTFGQFVDSTPDILQILEFSTLQQN